MVKVTALSVEDGDACPVRQVLSKSTGKWQMLILLTLDDGPQRFGELKRSVGDITQRVLTENLRSLERDGYLTRTVHAGPPIAVTYTLSDQGKSYTAHLMALVSWAAENFSQVKEARDQYDRS